MNETAGGAFRKPPGMRPFGALWAQCYGRAIQGGAVSAIPTRRRDRRVIRLVSARRQAGVRRYVARKACEMMHDRVKQAEVVHDPAAPAAAISACWGRAGVDRAGAGVPARSEMPVGQSGPQSGPARAGCATRGLARQDQTAGAAARCGLAAERGIAARAAGHRAGARQGGSRWQRGRKATHG